MRPRARSISPRPLAATFAIALALAGAALLVTSCRSREAPPTAETAAGRVHYTCPMHPDYVSDKPGDCPVCHMRLVKVEGHASHASHAAGADSSHAPPGYVPITISPEQEQLIGVRLARATRGPAALEIRAVGKVSYDETRLHHVHTKVDGWIGHLYVDYTGKLVRHGEPLFTLYSPELVSTQEEYLLARRSATAGAGDALLQSVRRRLELWDIPEEEIRDLETRGTPETYVDIVSHASGVVVEKKAIEGMRAMPGEELYLLADLARVWITASIYEYELPHVRAGQEARVTLTYQPGAALTGRVTYVYPYLDEKTRTAEVRFEFENPDLALKPGMFAHVELEVPLGEALTIPRDAVLDSGDRQIVFVAAGRGRFEPRQVALGAELDGKVVVREGLSDGEEVVSAAQFLIDSESQLRAALAGMGGAGAHQH